MWCKTTFKQNEDMNTEMKRRNSNTLRMKRFLFEMKLQTKSQIDNNHAISYYKNNKTEIKHNFECTNMHLIHSKNVNELPYLISGTSATFALILPKNDCLCSGKEVKNIKDLVVCALQLVFIHETWLSTYHNLCNDLELKHVCLSAVTSEHFV